MCDTTMEEDVPMAVASTGDMQCRFSLEKVCAIRCAHEELFAHSTHACAVSSAAGVAVFGHMGLEFTSKVAGARIETGCCSACGNFLFLGDAEGRLHLLHLASEDVLWSQSLLSEEEITAANASAMNEDSHEASRSEDASVSVESVNRLFAQFVCVVHPSSGESSLFILLSRGVLFRFYNFDLSSLQGRLPAAGEEHAKVMEDFKASVAWATHQLQHDCFRICTSPEGHGGKFVLYACGEYRLHIHGFDKDVQHARESVTILDDGFDEDWDDESVGRGRSPNKRSRLNPLERCSRPLCDDLVYFAAWGELQLGQSPVAGDEPGDVQASLQEQRDVVGNQNSTVLIIVLRNPGQVLVYDTAVFFHEMHRWHAPDGATILAAGMLKIPSICQGIGKAGQGTASLGAELCVALSTKELVVYSVARGILFKTDLAMNSVSTPLITIAPSGWVGQVPNSSCHESATEQKESDEISSGQRAHTICFIGTVVDGPDEALQSILFGLRGEVLQEDSPMDTADMEDMLVTGIPQELDLPQLRRQMEYLVQKSAEGKLLSQEKSDQFMFLAKQLVGSNAGFVARNIRHACFPDLDSTREALRAGLRLLQDKIPSSATEAQKKPLTILGDVLTRLNTFEKVHWSIQWCISQEGKACSGELPAKFRRTASGSGKVGQSSPGSPIQLPTPSRRRASLPSDIGSHTSAAVSSPVASSSKRRHSVLTTRTTSSSGFTSLQDQTLRLLEDLPDLEGQSFANAWQQFRKCKLADFCIDLASVGRLMPLFIVFDRHGCSLQEDSAMKVLEALPIEDLSFSELESLPQWIQQQVVPRLSCRKRLLQWLIDRAEWLEAKTRSPHASIELLHSINDYFQRGTFKHKVQGTRAAEKIPSMQFPRWLISSRAFWAGIRLATGAADMHRSSLGPSPPEQPSNQQSLELATVPSPAGATEQEGDSDIDRRFCELGLHLQECAYIRKVHELHVSLEEIRSMSRERIAMKLLDRIGAPQSLECEIRTHVEPFCQWQKLSMDSVLSAYATELIRSLCSPEGQLQANGGVRMSRAIAVLKCVESLHYKGGCLVELLKQWKGGEVPAELDDLLAERQSWPSEHRVALEEQISLLGVKKALMKYGFDGGSIVGDVKRMVEHLLSRVDLGVASLQDAFEVIRIFPRITSADALYTRLTKIAGQAHDDIKHEDDHCKAIIEALDCASSLDERLSATQGFVAYCCTNLEDMSKEIESCRQDHQTFNHLSMYYYWKGCSKVHCTLGRVALQQLLVTVANLEPQTHSESGTGEVPRTRFSSTRMLDTLERLEQLHNDFDLYLDPMVLMPQEPLWNLDEDDEVAEPTAEMLESFHVHGTKMIKQFLLELPNSNEASKEVGNAFTRLLRFGNLIGLKRVHVCKAIVREASGDVLFSLCDRLMTYLNCSTDPEAALNLVQLGCRMLREFYEEGEQSQIQTIRDHSQVLYQFVRMESVLVSVLSNCPPENISDVSEFAGDVRFALEVLLQSDILEPSNRGPLVQNCLSSLSVLHQHSLGSVSDCLPSDSQCRALQRSYQEVPIGFPGKVAAKAALDFLHMKRDTQSPGNALPGFLKDLLRMLKASESLELTIELLLRHEEAMTKALKCKEDDFRNFCIDAAKKVLSSSDPVDNVLAVGYMLCLEPSDIEPILKDAISTCRYDFLKLQRTARLGSDLCILWNNTQVYKKMTLYDNHGKWCQRLSLLGISFDSTKLLDCSKFRSGSSQSEAIYQTSLLPSVIQASRSALGLSLDFGRNYSIPDQKVITLLIEMTLLSPVLISSDASGQRDAFDLWYQDVVPAALAHLDAAAHHELLWVTIKNRVSPYDYNRIRFVLNCCQTLPDANRDARRYLKVLDVLADYTRTAPPNEDELNAIDVWCMQRGQEKLHSDSARLNRHIRQLASQFLPWRALVSDEADPWVVLKPEVRNSLSIQQLCALRQPLHLDTDLFHVHFLHHTLDSLNDSSLDSVWESHGAEVFKTNLLQIQDVNKAWDIAEKIEKRMGLSRAQVDVARCRLELVQRAQRQRASSEDNNLDRMSEKMQQHVVMLESRLELAKAKLSHFEEVLQEHGIKTCIHYLYYYLIPLLLQPSVNDCCNDVQRQIYLNFGSPNKADRGAWDLHDLVDSICAKSNESGCKIRQQLIDQWLVNLAWTPSTVNVLESKLTSITENLDQFYAGVASGSLRHPSAGEAVHNSLNFVQSPEDKICQMKVTFLAWPRSSIAEDSPTEDAKSNVRYLLKTAFAKESKCGYDVKCRALAVVMSIASEEQISRAYRAGAEDLRGLWQLYMYMDCLHKAGIPKTFQQLGTCNKDALAKSLWKRRQDEPRVVQLTAALCLDYGVSDPCLWAQILSKLHSMKLYDFLHCVLNTIHESQAVLPHDESLEQVFATLFKAPLEALCEWITEPAGAPSPLVQWLTSIPYWLRRNAFLDYFDLRALAQQLLHAAVHATKLSHNQSSCLSRIVWGDHTALLPESAKEVSEALAWLTVELVSCDLKASRVERFLRDDLVEHHPSLVVPCLRRCRGQEHWQIFFDGVLKHNLIAEAYMQLDSKTFESFVLHAIFEQDVAALLTVALRAQREDHVYLLLQRFGQVHVVENIHEVLMGDAHPDSLFGPANYLAAVAGRLRSDPTVIDTWSSVIKRFRYQER